MVRTAVAIFFCVEAHPLTAHDGTVPPLHVVCVFPTVRFVHCGMDEGKVAVLSVLRNGRILLRRVWWGGGDWACLV